MSSSFSSPSFPSAPLLSPLPDSPQHESNVKLNVNGTGIGTGTGTGTGTVKRSGNANSISTLLQQAAVEFESCCNDLIQMDAQDGTQFAYAMSELSPAEILDRLRVIEKTALALGFEEAREMQQGRQLNIFDSDFVHQPSPSSAPQPLSLVSEQDCNQHVKHIHHYR